jgi:hypothetical protein
VSKLSGALETVVRDPDVVDGVVIDLIERLRAASAGEIGKR